MTNAEAKIKIEKLCVEYNKKEDIIAKEAKAKGILKPGLDSNRELFAELNEEFYKKMDEIVASVDK